MAANWGWARQLRKAVDDRLIGGPHVVPSYGLGSASTVLQHTERSGCR